MKAFNLRLLVIGLLALTGCKTGAVKESSFWQMLPFTGSKANMEKPKVAPAQPAAVAAVVTPAPKVVPTPAKPEATVPPVALDTKVEQPIVSTKKNKKIPPAVAINLPVTPSKKSTTPGADHAETPFTSTADLGTPIPATPAQSFRLSDWVYDEKAHEQWRQKQLDEIQGKVPIHQYESAQLNRAFYNLILNEPTTAPLAPTAKP